MSEVTQHNIGNKLDISLKSLIENEWMHNLWVWADKHNIDKEELPRDKQSLLQLKSLTLAFSFFNINQKNTEKKLDLDLDNKPLTKERMAEIVEMLVEEGYSAIVDSNENAVLPKELGMLTYLEEFCISMNPIERLPDEITNLKSLKKLCLCHNVNLVLTQEQKEWVIMLELNGADVSYDKDLFDRV